MAARAEKELRNILAIDVGTTALKAGVFTPDLELLQEFSQGYPIRVEGLFTDIEPQRWWNAVKQACAELKPHLDEVGTVSFSVTTPGLLPMDADGKALGPAILFSDGRSRAEAADIRERVGEEYFLKETCNLPVSGGSSLASILWIKKHRPDIWDRTARFGHTNTYMAKRFTGNWVIDPSTVSITGMYGTAANELNWNVFVLEKAGIPMEKLPPIKNSFEAAGTILPRIADELGLPRDCRVLTGGNDAVLAAYSAGLDARGKAIDICGTCDIIAACIDKPVASPNFNIRCHVIPGLWVTFFVLNTGGKAYEWFKTVFASEMDDNRFYNEYMPGVIENHLADGDTLPAFTPYLQGSRYSLENLTAAFQNVSLNTTRDHFLLGLLKGNFTYLGEHIREVSRFVDLSREMITTGGGAKIRGIASLKKRWMGDFEYIYRDQSSLKGAAMLANASFR